MTSPNYPEVYAPNTVCKWNLTTEKGNYISLDFEHIYVSNKDMISNVWVSSNLLILQQFGFAYSDDYITIYDITDDGKSTVIANLTSPDIGPISSEFTSSTGSRWQKKIISSTSNKMLVEFRSDDVDEYYGFSASIHYSPLPSKECENELDITKKTIQSPNYPDAYNNNLSCKWLISVPHGSYITLKFLQLDVGGFLVISISN